MPFISVIYILGATLLAAAGISKQRNPAPTRTVMTEVGLRSSDLATRALGGVEATAGAAALAGFAPAAIAMAVMYVAFALVLLRLIALGKQNVGCGCIGTEVRSVSLLHVVFNLAVATCVTTVYFVGPPSLAELASRTGWFAPVAALGIAATALGVRAAAVHVQSQSKATPAARTSTLRPVFIRDEGVAHGRTASS